MFIEKGGEYTTWTPSCGTRGRKNLGTKTASVGEMGQPEPSIGALFIESLRSPLAC